MSATVVPSRFFDTLWEALDAPAVPSPSLQHRSVSERHIEQKQWLK